MDLLSIEEINEWLEKTDGWSSDNKSIVKEFQKKDFTEALSFLLKIGIEAEKKDHHPDLLLYSWNKIRVTLSTHSAGGLTEHDFRLAEIIDKLQ
ncbi:MAG: 4a-hydroxytetrahydrobiopterin dehydratase [Melioribacteraceae bacterium]|nr:4a-hydroxytetrahydrobiopterin dehydratase [Melioribacteraceae bacterium]